MTMATVQSAAPGPRSLRAVMTKIGSATETAKTAATFWRIAIPLMMLVLLTGVWVFYVWAFDVPHYILPSPMRMAETLYTDWPIL